jgi:lipoprotein-anchoring transpeptidase ErfK/SrfK
LSERYFRGVLAVQTILDRHNLSGGRIDGVIGPRTRAALAVWQDAHGLPATGTLTDATRTSILDSGTNAFTLYTITTNDHAELTIVPDMWTEKAYMPRLGYETIQEMLAERYHASEKALQTLNPAVAWPNPPAGTEVTVPNPFPVVAARAERLTISLSGKWVRAYNAASNVVAHFPCSIAANKSKRPVGELRVMVAAADPNYTFNPEVFPEVPEARTLQGRKLIIPPGPNNPVGVAWVGLNLPGYGIHGTPHPGDIGKTESHGCFRLANWNAAKLLRLVRPGMPVIVEE